MGKIISIDPAGDGVTAIIIAEYDYNAEEPVKIVNFAQVDFRAEGETNSEYAKEIRYIQLEKLIAFILENKPYAVILENFIMYRQQMSRTSGHSFKTSELIGAIELECRRHKIPVVKPRASDIRQYNGYGQKSELKSYLSNFALQSRGILVKGKNGRNAIVVNGNKYELKEFQIGSKNDHLLMAIRHLVNEIEYKTPNLFDKVEKIKRQRYEKDYGDI